MSELRTLADALHPLERKVLPALKKHAGAAALAKATGLKDVEVVRALQWLQNKGLARLESDTTQLALLTPTGKDAHTRKLPEMRMLRALSSKPEELSSVTRKAELNKQEVGAAIGQLRRMRAIIMAQGPRGPTVAITAEGKRRFKEGLHLEYVLATLAKGPVPAKKLDMQEFKELRSRGLIETKTEKTKRGMLTKKGTDLLKLGLGSGDVVDRLTPQAICSGAWSKKKFRAYDTQADVPRICGGRLQPYRQFLDWVRQRFMALGFCEMGGPIVESDFYDMDALFMPQFHSARDIHEAYYVKAPTHDKSLDPSLLRRIKAVHENGGDTGSHGWHYTFDVERTRRLLLRTQGTACSARMLASKDIRIPGKYFGITRCFRYDVIDATHLPDFNQTEGIVVEEGLTFQHLVGLLRMFAREFAGTDEIKVVPGYFPFTEPSAELFAKHPQLGWVELGGAGLLRPEVVKPLLGKDMSVLAWGLGIDRLGMFRLGIKDIRSLFSHDLSFLRSARVMR